MRFLPFFLFPGFSLSQPGPDLARGHDSFRSLGHRFYVDVEVKRVKGARLVLFNRELARELDIPLPKTSEDVENLVLDWFAWFKTEAAQTDDGLPDDSRAFLATRYQDSDDKFEGCALGDGRAVWVGELSKPMAGNKTRYMDVVVKGIGVTPLAWLNHPKKSHRDGMVGITEAVHEYIHSLAAAKNGIDTVSPLAVIELPFLREATQEKAALIVRVGNHLRFAHYRYFSKQPEQLERIFEFGLKRDLGFSPHHRVSPQDVRDYLDHIVTHLANEAAAYYDLHAVHGSPTFGNRTSNGGTIDLSTFVYLDAHHGEYRYMPGGSYSLGGKWGQHEQMFVLFSGLAGMLRDSRFKYADEVLPEKVFWEKFRDTMEQNLTQRWLKRLGLADSEIAALSSESKRRFFHIMQAIYEAPGRKKIKLNRGKTRMAAFKPRKVLSQTARHFGLFHDEGFVWENLFRVQRHWGTLSFSHAQPFIAEYIQAVQQIVAELDETGRVVGAWQSRGRQMRLSERGELGADFFYGAERFASSTEVLAQIRHGEAGWTLISATAAAAAEKLVDRF